MLKITVELAPFGNEDEKRVLETFVIHNIGPVGKLETGWYNYKISKSLTDPALIFQHYRPDGVLACVHAGLECLRGEDGVPRLPGLDKTPLL